MKWYWLSFVIDGVNVGCCNVQATSKYTALDKTHLLGINPGGEVMIGEIPAPELEPDKLISRAELVKLGYLSVSEAEQRGLKQEDLPVEYICPACNAGVKCTIHN
jgi:hypothetical protein